MTRVDRARAARHAEDETLINGALAGWTLCCLVVIALIKLW